MDKEALKLPLLEFLAHKCGCEYLSDLPQEAGRRPANLQWILSQIPAEATSLKEWNDALHYLVDAPKEETAQAARTRLIELLSMRK